MTAHIATKQNINTELESIYNEIDAIHADGGEARIEITKKATRTKSMNALWRGKWMPETAAWMRGRDVLVEIKNSKGKVISSRPVTADDAHSMFVMHWLGCNDEGLRELTRDMQKSRMLFMMDKHSHWAVEKGLLLTYPSDSEFNKLKEAQNE